MYNNCIVAVLVTNCTGTIAHCNYIVLYTIVVVVVIVIVGVGSFYFKVKGALQLLATQ